MEKYRSKIWQSIVLPHYVKEKVLKLLRDEITHLCLKEMLKYNLIREYGWILLKNYSLIDKKQLGIITYSDMYELLTKFNY